MIDLPIDQFVAEGWLFAVLRILFIGLVYLFLFLVMRATVRELHAAAHAMGTGEGGAAPMALLTLDAAESSLRPGEALPLHAATSLGRVAGNTIVVDDPHTSARHAEIRFERGQWWLRDLDSSNGTTLNGHRVRAVVGVWAGDVIQCGRVRFRLIPSFSVPRVDASV